MDETLALYNHTQRPHLVWYAVMFYSPVVLMLVIALLVEEDLGVSYYATLIGVALVMTLFFAGTAGLNVLVSSAELHVRWQLGWPTKTFSRSEITAVEAVRNKWWYGFGVRYTPHGWMWNVWGLDAVQISLANGKGFRIGTNDPEGLVAALR